MSKPGNSSCKQKVPSKWRPGRIALLTLILLFLFTLAAVLLLRQPHSCYWSGGTISLKVQSLAPGGAFSEEGLWVRSGWSGPTGAFTRGELYGLKMGNRLLRLDIVYDPITAIRKRLPNSVTGLLEAITSKDSLVRKCAGEALVKMGSAAHSALPVLLKRYQQGDEEVEWVILDLAKSADSHAVSPLSESLHDLDSKVRQKAAEALGEIGPHAAAAVPKLMQALHDSVPNVVVASAISLRKIDKSDHGEVAALIPLLANEDFQVRGSAVFALGEFGNDAAAAVQPLLKLLDNGDHEAAGLVARTLGLIGPAAKPAIPQIVHLLNAKDPQTLMFAMEALGRFGEDARDAIPKLLELAQKSDQMWGAISALSAMGTDALPGLIDLYRNGRHGQSSWAARAFMKQGPKAAAAVPALVEDLSHERASRATLAAMVLGRIGTEARPALPRLAELIHDDNPHLRLRAAEALWRLDRQTNAVLPVMILELETWAKEPNALLSRTADAHGQSRQQVAAGVLGEIGPAAHEAVPLLRLMLRSSYEGQKTAAAEALGRIDFR